MSKPKLIYFDAPVSRGEECRLALHLAGIDFEDVRIKPADWPAMKERMPYGSLPVLELPGGPALGHSNAIMVLIGRRHGLHPADDFESGPPRRDDAARRGPARACLAHAPHGRRGEESCSRGTRCRVPARVGQGGGEKHRCRAVLRSGDKIHVVDLKIHMAVRWFSGGNVDHIPATIFAGYPRLIGVHDAVRDHPGVRSWYASMRSW